MATKIPDTALAVCLIGHITNDRSYPEGAKLRGSDGDVRLHPGMYVEDGTLTDAELRAATRALMYPADVPTAPAAHQPPKALDADKMRRCVVATQISGDWAIVRAEVGDLVPADSPLVKGMPQNFEKV
jgi:hypothetical protein